MTAQASRVRRTALLLFLIGSAVGFVVAGQANLAPKDDALQFLSIGSHLAHGQGFADDDGPTMVREPLYPAFIAVVFRLSGDSRIVVLLAQALLLGALAVGTFLLARQGIPEGWAAAAGAGVVVTLAAYAGLFLSETLAAVSVLSATALLAAADRRPSLRRFLAAGALLGTVALVKSVVLYFVPIAVIAVVLRGRSDIRRAFIRAAILAAAFLMVTIPWMSRNNARFGVTQIASRGGLVLYVRANRTLLSAHDRHLLMSQAILGDRLTAKLSPDILDKQAMLDGSAAMWQEYVSLRASGLSDAEVDARFGHAAVLTILRHPFAYATDTIQEFFLFNMLALPVVDMRALFATGHPDLTDVVKDLTVASLRIVNFAWIALVGYGIWASRKKPALFWPACFIIYWNLIHMAVDAIPRYAVPVLPLYLVFAAEATRRLVVHVRYVISFRNRAAAPLPPAGSRIRPGSSS